MCWSATADLVAGTGVAAVGAACVIRTRRRADLPLAALPLLLGAPLVLLPLHVVFLELIIDPASTLVFEREPAAEDVMRRPPRAPDHPLLDARVLFGGLALRWRPCRSRPPSTSSSRA